jgi:hypothetical protein
MLLKFLSIRRKSGAASSAQAYFLRKFDHSTRTGRGISRQIGAGCRVLTKNAGLAMTFGMQVLRAVCASIRCAILLNPTHWFDCVSRVGPYRGVPALSSQFHETCLRFLRQDLTCRPRATMGWQPKGLTT